MTAIGLKNVDDECLHRVRSFCLGARDRGLSERDTEADENGEQKNDGAQHAGAMPSNKLQVAGFGPRCPRTSSFPFNTVEGVTNLNN